MLAIRYIPPGIKPKTTGTRSLTRLYMLLQLKKRLEQAATSRTHAPNAMMEEMTGFLRFARDARIAQAISGKLAMKSQIRESNIVPVDEVPISSPLVKG